MEFVPSLKTASCKKFCCFKVRIRTFLGKGGKRQIANEGIFEIFRHILGQGFR